MKGKVERNIINNNIMKYIALILLILIFLSCKTYENSFKNRYKTEVLYKERNNCYLFKPKKVSHYSSEKCFKILFGFSAKEHQQLKDIYLKEVDNDKRFIRKYQKKYVIFFTSPVKEKNKVLVNSANYGLFRIVGTRFAPNIYFLRTETNIYFYNCKYKDTLIDKLNRSKSINNVLKNEITLFIEKECNTKDGLKWYSGARFF